MFKEAEIHLNNAVQEVRNLELELSKMDARNRDLEVQLFEYQDINYEQENMIIFEEKRLKGSMREKITDLQFELNTLHGQKSYLK